MKITEQAIPGGWGRQTFTVAGRRLELAMPADPDAFLEAAEEAPQRWPDPYWATVWPAAERLAADVAEHDWTDGVEMIELGCGAGLVGLTALAVGARVTFADYVPEAIQLVLENAGRNHLPGAAGWVMDWNQPPHRRWPVVLASDVLYNERAHGPLLRWLERGMEPTGECWIGDPGRFRSETFLRDAARDFELHLVDDQGRSIAKPRAGAYQRITLRRRR